MTESEIEDVAAACHEINRAYCRLIGDNTQVSWKNAPEWQRTSAINGVKFHLANPNSQPSDSHESWSKEKVADGWSFGPVKDPAKKQHPCLVPFSNLPLHQQMKDFIFLSTVRAAEAIILEDS
jgi:hypothetical protein